VPGGWWSARVALAAVLMMMLTVTGCARQAAPAPAVERTTPPPWNAPRDAVSYIEAAGLEPQPISTGEKSGLVKLRIVVDGAPVEEAIEAAALRSTRGAIILLAILLLGWQALAWQARRVSAPREDDLDLFQAQLDEATQLKL